MDQTTKPLFRAWAAFLGILVLSAAALVVSGEKSVSPRAFAVADLGASRTGSVAELTKSKEWLEQVKFFNKNYFGPESSDWRNPPASRNVSPDILSLQQTNNDSLATLWVYGPTESVPEGKYRIGMSSSQLSGSDPIAPIDILFGPVLRSSDSVSLWMWESGSWWSKSDVTQRGRITTSDLGYDQPVILNVNVLPNNQAAVGQQHVSFRLQLMKFDPEKLGDKKNYDAASSASEILPKVVEGSLSFNDLKVAQDGLIKPAGRYTTLIISADRDPRPYLSCTRSDTGAEVGVYSDSLRLLAVTANGWAALNVRARVHNFGEKLNYRIVSLSSNEVTSKALLLWFVAYDLTNKKVEDRVLSLPEIDARARWLKSAFDVQITDQEVANTADPDVRTLLAHLASVQ